MHHSYAEGEAQHGQLLKNGSCGSASAQLELQTEGEQQKLVWFVLL